MTNSSSPGPTSIDIEHLCSSDQIFPWGQCDIGEDPIGCGAAMDVYKGTLTIDGVMRPAAFKEPRSTQLEKVRRSALQATYEGLKKEIDYMKRAKDHQNVVHFYGLTFRRDQKERPLLIVELAQTTLEEYLTERSNHNNVPNWWEKLEYCLQIAKGIHALHRERIIHGDIKGSNILVFEGGGTVTLKISDFGFSSTITSITGRTGGSISFTAPEGLTSANKYPELKPYSIKDQRKDIYSFGLVVWQILKDGGYPFEGVEASEIERMKMDGELTELLKMLRRDTPTFFIDIIRACTKFKPNDRMDFPVLIEKLSDLLATRNPAEISWN